jgi:endonuclease YncB( thermonuclease family)
MPSLARRQAISLRLSNSDGMIKVLAAAVIAAESGVVSVADAMRRSDIYVIDGDTIEVQAKRIRLMISMRQTWVASRTAALSEC